MATDSLYDLAFEYKKTALWKTVWDTDVFALRFSDGEIGYLCVMGHGGSYTALGVYLGDAGFNSYMDVLEMENEECHSFFAYNEQICRQTCIQLAFENKDGLRDEEIEEVRAYTRNHGIRLSGKKAYPQFIKYVTHKLPWNNLTPQDEKYLGEALEAAIALSGMLKGKKPADIGITGLTSTSTKLPLMEKTPNGYKISDIALPKRVEPVYPVAKGIPNKDIAELQKLTTGGVLECELIIIPDAVRDGEGKDAVPFFPAMLMMVVQRLEFIIPMDIVSSYSSNQDADNVIRSMVEAMKKVKFRPDGILARDERTYELLKNFATSLGIKITQNPDLPALDAAQDAMVREFGFDHDPDQGVQVKLKLDDVMNTVEEVSRMPDDMIAKLPGQMIKSLEMLLDMEELSPEHVEMIKRILDVYKGGMK